MNHTTLEAPFFLGQMPKPPPPTDWIPGECREIEESLRAVMEEIYSPKMILKKSDDEIIGRPASSGVYQGRAVVVLHAKDLSNVQKGDVLVIPSTSSSFNFVFPLLGAIVADEGGNRSRIEKSESEFL